MLSLQLNNFNDDIVSLLIRQFYRGTYDFMFQHKDVENLTLSKQEEFLNATLNRPLLKKYPMRNEFIKIFLKKLIAYLETCQDVHDDIYKYLCVVMNTPSKVCYRHYIIGKENSITIRESNNMVVNGTTGMRTWEAALMLADWGLNHKEVFKNKKLLELGSGTGFTGISLAMFCQPETILMTDCHEDVLTALKDNIKINFPDAKHKITSDYIVFQGEEVNIGVRKLDWTNINMDSTDFCPDVVVGADIVYDPSILQPLCDVFKFFIDKNRNIEIYIAGVVRSEDTINKFLNIMETESILYQRIYQKENVYLDWKCDTEHYLLKINMSDR